MKIALNGATTMKADLEADIRAAGGTGFDGIELWASKLHRFLENNSTTRLKELLHGHGLEAFSINSIERITFRDETGTKQLHDECERLCSIASEVACPYVVVVPSPLPAGTSESQVIDKSVSVLETLGDIASQFGVGLAFEFLGQPDCSVQTLELADEIVQRVNRDNVGLVIDTFHFYAGGSKLESIRALDPKRLFIFHLNDAENRPRSELKDCHRLLPGQGILPLADIIGSLRSINYSGIASIEIFRPEYWEMDPNELARKAHASANLVLGLS